MLTVKQAAERIGVSESLIYAWVQSGSLPHYRLGRSRKRGKIMIDPEDLAALLASMKVEGQQVAPDSPVATRPSASGRASSGSPAAPFSELDPERLRRAWEKR